MSSLGEIREIYGLLQQIDALLAKIEVKGKSTERQMERTVSQIIVVERTLLRTLSLLQRLTGDENIDNAINKIIRLITVINQLRLAMSLLMATNPWMWPLGILGIVTAAVSMNDLAGSFA